MIVETLVSRGGNLVDVYRNPSQTELLVLKKKFKGYRLSIDVNRDVSWAWNGYEMIHSEVLSKLEETKSSYSKTPWVHLNYYEDTLDVGIKNLTGEHLSTIERQILSSNKYLTEEALFMIKTIGDSL